MEHNQAGYVIEELRKLKDEKLKEVNFIKAIMSLIEEQETMIRRLQEVKPPIVPKFRAGTWYCGNCKAMLGAGGTASEDSKTKKNVLFCRKCGKAIDWESAYDDLGE